MPAPSSFARSGQEKMSKDGTFIHPRTPKRATAALRNREVQLAAHKNIGVTAICSTKRPWISCVVRSGAKIFTKC
jgi:hypothetical protein